MNVMPEAMVMLEAVVMPKAMVILEILRHLGPDPNVIMNIGDRNNPLRSLGQRRIPEIQYAKLI